MFDFGWRVVHIEKGAGIGTVEVQTRVRYEACRQKFKKIARKKEFVCGGRA